MADQPEVKQPEPKRNKDGFIPGQRVTAKQLAEYRAKQRRK